MLPSRYIIGSALAIGVLVCFAIMVVNTGSGMKDLPTVLSGDLMNFHSSRSNAG